MGGERVREREDGGTLSVDWKMGMELKDATQFVYESNRPQG